MGQKEISDSIIFSVDHTAQDVASRVLQPGLRPLSAEIWSTQFSWGGPQGRVVPNDGVTKVSTVPWS